MPDLRETAPEAFPEGPSLALDDLPVAAALVRNDRLLVWNRLFGQLLGFGADERVRFAFSGFWSDPDGEGAAFRQALEAPRHRREMTTQACWKRLDGSPVWVEIRCRLRSAGAAEAAAWIVVVSDVSRHHRAQDFLQLHRNLVEFAQDGMAIVDSGEGDDPRCVFVNPAWERMSGYSAEDAIGRAPLLLPPPETSSAAFARIWGAIGEGRSVSETVCFQRRDGREFWCDVSVFPLPGGTGAARQSVLVTRDVTRRIETNLKLAQSERRFRHLFVDNHLPMFLVGTENDRIVEANPAAEAFYDYPRDQLAGMRLIELSGDAPPASRDVDLQAFATDGEVRRHQTRGGKARDVLCYTGHLQLEEGRVRYMIVVDVTAQREAERQLRLAMREAEAANSAKSEFLQVVGHEIRTPMNAIIGFAQLLASADNEAERADCVEMIRQGTQGLETVLEAVVDYISWNTAGRAADDDEVELRDFAREVVAPFATEATEKGLELGLNLGSIGAERVGIPAADYQRIIGFVLDNALKFTAEGSVGVEWTVSGTELEVCISDTGIGIEERVKAQLFKPFSTGDGGTRRIHDGLGLGLARCHRMTTSYGGQVQVESERGRGSRVSIRLPIRLRD